MVATACLALAIALPAAADIKTYNAAVLRGDFPAAATAAEAAWASFDKTRPETATIAREFAWTSMLARRPEKARSYAQWLIDEGPRLPTPDDDPLIARVLLRWADLGNEPDRKKLATLSEALRAWAASSKTPSRIAVRAASDLYAHQWNNADWESTRRDALLTAEYANRLGAETLSIEMRAKVDAAAAQFMDNRRIEAWFTLADVHDELMERTGPPKPGEDVGALDLVDARAHAWLEAMGAYFAGNQRYKRLEARKKTLKDRCGDADCYIMIEPGTAPRCVASWDQSPQIVYPASAVYRGMIGATILELTSDETGAVTDVKVLAAVPTEKFPDATMKAVRQWTLKKQAKASPEPCTLAGKRKLVAIFQMH